MDADNQSVSMSDLLEGFSSIDKDADRLTGLTEMLRTGNRSSAGDDVIFRPGNSDDVMQPEKEEKKYWEPTSDGNTW
jgi:hypothetical protein